MSTTKNTALEITAERPGLRAWVKMTMAEAKMVARDTAGLIIPLGLPLLILVMAGASVDDVVVADGHTVLDLFVVPVALTIILAVIGIINMPSFLAYYRRSGILRRLAVTPASPAMVLVAQTVVSVLQALLGVVLALAVAVFVLGANYPVDVGATVGVFLLAMAAMYAVGMIVASLAPTPNSAVAIGMILFLGLGALGGMFGGMDALPESLAALTDWLPFGAAVQALGAAWTGTGIEMVHMLSLGVTTALGAGVAALMFRWE